MADKDIYKSLIAFSQAYSDALKPLNLKTMNFFASDGMANALNSLSATIRVSVPKDVLPLALQESFQSMTHAYTSLLGEYNLGHSISESLRSVLASIQVNTMFQLSQSHQTVMIHDLASCFASAQYGGLVDVLNQTMARSVIEAPDIAFIKTSDLVQALDSELLYPRGLSHSLRLLNRNTADDIADNKELNYSTTKNRFVSSEGEVDSKGLNIICSGREVLTTPNVELFTENELIDFCSFLSRTPMLALNSPTGQKIYEMLKDMYLSGMNSISFDKNVYYHCRSHKKAEMPFTYEQMLKAPHGLPWAGRYNQVGRSNYYFADTQKGAEAEVKKHKTDNDVLQTVKLKPAKNIKMLDLSGSLARGKTFLRYLRFSLTDVVNKMPREYLIPCFVSDCCNALGFDGIKYYGSKEYSNYVVWNDGYFDYDGMCSLIDR